MWLIINRYMEYLNAMLALSVIACIIGMIIRFPGAGILFIISVVVFLLYSRGYRRVHTPIRRVCVRIEDVTDAIGSYSQYNPVSPAEWKKYRNCLGKFALRVDTFAAIDLVNAYDNMNLNSEVLENKEYGRMLDQLIDELRKELRTYSGRLRNPMNPHQAS